MQAGLSCLTILLHREAMRCAFDGFSRNTIAQYDTKKEQSLLHNAGIIRHTLKIKSLRKNARAFQAIQRIYGSFDAYIWSFTGRKSIIGYWYL